MKRRYLTGMDWVIHTLDYNLRKRTGCGNFSQVVLELESRPDEELLRSRIEDMNRSFPLIYGKASRDYNLCPYWKTYHQHKILPLDFNIYERSDVFSVLEEIANRPFRNKGQHLDFNLIYGKDITYLSMVFDHRLLDARGAETLLTILQEGNFSCGPSLVESAHLNRWCEKFRSGRNVNRAFIRLPQNDYCFLKPEVKQGIGKFKFRTIYFNKLDSREITEAAENKAGYLMFMPYILTLCLQGIDRIFKKRNVGRGNYIVPVSIDTREKGTIYKNLFFNHFSFLFFQFPLEKLANSSWLLESAKNQMYEQIKNGLPEDFKKASFLLRIAPLPLLGFFFKPPNSFSFSCIGQSTYNSSYFCKSKVKNIFHLPRVSLPPGIGLFFNQFQQGLNLTFSYYDTILSDSEADALVSDLKFSLQAG